MPLTPRETTLVRICASIASQPILYPEERTGYETDAERAESYKSIQSQALSTFVGADGDVLTALSMLARHYQSIISGARARQKQMVADINEQAEDY